MNNDTGSRTTVPGNADIANLIALAHSVIARHAAELSQLDSDIGDADHGINMQRGFAAVSAQAQELSAMPLPDALTAAGMKLVMTIGGASGPLYGTLLMTLGKELARAGGQPVERAAFNAAFLHAVDAVAARGKSTRGQKTMLDVLYPVADALNAGAGPVALAQLANDAAIATTPLKATRGRASFLGERSIGHMDPGSRSSALLVGVATEWLEGLK